MADEKRVNYIQLEQMAEEVGGPDLQALMNYFHELESAVASLGNYYEADRARDLITQLKQIVNQVMAEVEPVCKEFSKVAQEEANHWRTFATSKAAVAKA